MGTSTPPPQKNIKVDVKLIIDSNTLKGFTEEETYGIAAPPINSVIASAIAKGEDGKDIPVNLEIKKPEIDINQDINKKFNEINLSTSDESNRDNNTKRKKEKKDNINNSINNFSIFSNEFSNNNDKYENSINDNNNNINNDNIVNNNEINDKNNNDKNNDIKNKNSFLKEGIQSGTDFGNEEEDKQEKDNKHQTPGGIYNIDMNIAQNKQEENSVIKIAGKTPMEPEGNVDINQGSNYDKNKDKDNYLNMQYSNKDLEMSQSVVLKDPLAESQQFYEQGYLPLFIKLNNYKPLCFFIKEDSTLKSLVRLYLKNCPETDEGLEKDIELYNKGRSLDINKQIKYFNLEPYSRITNIKEMIK
jgi:hypothetical protein